MNENEIYKRAIEEYGKDSQLKMAIEEMAELTQAICKSFRGKDNVDNIIEEIADVEIMIAQLKIIFEIEPFKVNIWKGLKLAGLMQKLDDGTSDADII